MKQIITVPIQLESYDSIFTEIDYRPLNSRKVNEEIDTLLKDALFNKDLKQIPQLNLEIVLPSSIQDPSKEKLIQEGIENYYQSFTIYEQHIRKFGFARIVSYILTAFSLLVLNYFLQAYSPENFINTLIDTSATVILWQASTVIFIDSKDFTLNIRLNRLLSHVKVIFIYE